MKKKYLLLFLWAGLSPLFTSCDQKQENVSETTPPEVSVPEKPLPEAPSEEEVLYEEVMAIHDKAMVRMGEIRQLSEQLNDSIENTSANPMEQEEVINLYRNRLKELKDADGAMRVWMRQFGKEGEGLEGESRIAYLKEEKAEMLKVAQQMENAIREAREALQE